jgi:hypothetical protein
VEAMPFYEYEYIVQNLIDILKEKKEAEEGQSQDTDKNSVMKDAKKYMPAGFNPNNPTGNMKMPSIPSYSPSSFPSIPSSLKI